MKIIKTYSLQKIAQFDDVEPDFGQDDFNVFEENEIAKDNELENTDIPGQQLYVSTYKIVRDGPVSGDDPAIFVDAVPAVNMEQAKELRQKKEDELYASGLIEDHFVTIEEMQGENASGGTL